jgi:hypothetical protein
MAADFTVIVAVRQHFGNEAGWFDPVEPNVPFVGPTKDYTFTCTNVDPNAPAVLMFQTRDVDHGKNILQINDQPVFGGIPQSDTQGSGRGVWNGNIMLISAGVLRQTGNELHIESRQSSGSGGGDIDDFIIDNVVVLYKTR